MHFLVEMMMTCGSLGTNIPPSPEYAYLFRGPWFGQMVGFPPLETFSSRTENFWQSYMFFVIF